MIPSFVFCNIYTLLYRGFDHIRRLMRNPLLCY